MRKTVKVSVLAVLLAAAAALCLSATYAAAQPPPGVGEQLAKQLEGQPPLTAEEVQQYIAYTEAAAAGQPGTPYGGGDPARMLYISTKIATAIIAISAPTLPPERLAAQFGTPLAVATPEEIALVRSRQADIQGPAEPPTQ